MSNEWSGDGGFSKTDGEYRPGYQPQNEWNPGEPPTQDWHRPDWVQTEPQHRAEGGDNCGMSWASNPWQLLSKLVAWGLCIVIAFCILAFVAGCIVGVVEALS